MVHNSKLITQRKHHYISWNILFLWGFGLWIALCTNNIYHSDILVSKAALLSAQNWSSGFTYNIGMESEAMENVIHITATNCTLCNMVLTLKAVFQYVYVLVSVCFAVLLVYIRKHIKKSIKMWSNIMHNIYSVFLYPETISKGQSSYTFNRRTMIQSNHYTSQSKLIEKFSCEQKVTECILDEYIVQNEIKYTSYTLLLFNNHELYRYFNTQQFKNTCNSLIKYSEGKNLEHSNGKLISSRDNNKRTSTFQLKNSIQKRIITSSPEYQKFLANLKSRILCPCIFEISASYVIRIKSI